MLRSAINLEIACNLVIFVLSLLPVVITYLFARRVSVALRPWRRIARSLKGGLGIACSCCSL